MILRSLSLIILQLSVATAYTTFETNCSHPQISVNFVSSVNARGTLDILWSCLFTILACTWTVLHLNVPEQREERDPGWLGDIKWAMKRAWTNAEWMMITVLAPEVLLGKYCGDLQAAIALTKDMKELAEKDKVPWTLTHSFLANMGGFAIRAHDQIRLDIARSNDILYLRNNGLIPRLPYISLDEIGDRNKNDSLVRVIAITQISWTVVEALIRATRGLAISQLEIAVIAFAACAPKGVQTSIALLTYADKIPRRTIDALPPRSGYAYWLYETADFFFEHSEVLAGSRISNSNTLCDSVKDLYSMAGASIIFGGIHIAAWNFDFATKVEQILWWISSLWCTVDFLAFFLGTSFLIYAVDVKLGWISSDTSDKVQKVFIFIYILLYFLARLYLLIEIFRTLCFLPPTAYYSTWATNIPNVG
ncbi:uncharacterized protein LY89DRAFT_711343 [Mollisia scopiformis]|uniref:Uncharacterized protein n=1 Tax=Mollisia scopiformis TaxID=149040 RepID=A0A132B9M4_MOLSC|nr:uncharacterized protein LY89DRAFT_711343 [Mollisia scopiformis]KUJ09106.1 hypothetical protein LY89DRAFT_711343 [Mollisia scopiformis]